MLQPRATENPQIPISAIAVQKRISARIAIDSIAATRIAVNLNNRTFF